MFSIYSSPALRSSEAFKNYLVQKLQAGVQQSAFSDSLSVLLIPKKLDQLCLRAALHTLFSISPRL